MKNKIFIYFVLILMIFSYTVVQAGNDQLTDSYNMQTHGNTPCAVDNTYSYGTQRIDGSANVFSPSDGQSTSTKTHMGLDGLLPSDDNYNREQDTVNPTINENDYYTVDSTIDLPRDEKGNVIGDYQVIFTQGEWNEDYKDYFDTSESLYGKADGAQFMFLDMDVVSDNKLKAEGLQSVLDNFGVAAAVGIKYTYVDSKGETQEVVLRLQQAFYLIAKNQKAIDDNKSKSAGSSGTTSSKPSTSTSTPKSTGNTWSGSHEPTMSASINGLPYDISKGIPTSENIYATITVDDIGYTYEIGMLSQTVSYTVTAYIQWDLKEEERTTSYTLDNPDGTTTTHEFTWMDRYYDKSDVVRVTGQYTTHYFGVNSATMSVLSNGKVTNGAVGDIVNVGPSTASGSISKTGGLVFNPNGMSSSYSGVSDNSRDAAIASVKYAISSDIMRNTYAKNDTLSIKGVVLSGQTKKGQQFKSTPYEYPSHLSNPSVSQISNNGSKVIDKTVTNGLYSSSANANYVAVSGFNGKPASLSASVSRVFVHTPVVNNTTITVPDFENQKINKNSTATYLILDGSFTLNISDYGIHRAIPGYGTRKYNSYQGVYGNQTTWGKIKDAKLSFDVYLHSGNERIFIPANTWISEVTGASTLNYTFTVPVWVKEGAQTIQTRVIAENATDYNATQESANTDPENYVATKTLNVEVIGKIYDLQINNTTDPSWILKEALTPDKFPLGQLGQNANSYYKYAPKLGYTFVFNFKTKGVKSSEIEIVPSNFYFVSKTDGSVKKVNLYYNTTTAKYLQIQKGIAGKVDINMNLKDSWVKVSLQELVDSARIRGSKFNYGVSRYIGGFGKLTLPESIRLSYNNFAEYINKLYGAKTKEQIAANATASDKSTRGTQYATNGTDIVIDSVGRWYAGYKLPSSTKALETTKTLNSSLGDKQFLTNGYILVEFDLQSNCDDEKGGLEDYLEYMGPSSKNETQWNRESGNKTNTQTVLLPDGKKATVSGTEGGIVAVFDADLKATNDYETAGTH